MSLNSNTGNDKYEYYEAAPVCEESSMTDLKREANERRDPFHPVRRSKGEKHRNRLCRK